MGEQLIVQLTQELQASWIDWTEAEGLDVGAEGMLETVGTFSQPTVRLVDEPAM